MPRIILASSSQARKKLLEQIGLKFKVIIPSIKEFKVTKANYKSLVIRNALLKAENITKRVKKGIIISADTVVVADKTIIGKPKSIKDAFRILRLLSKEPHWVYTGLVVMDIEKKIKLFDYDKTKVWMCPLNYDQIRAYLRKAKPLDKAGSFDIQGLGGVFIDRIEGCFYNVVGLPLAKLVKLLNKVGIDIFKFDYK
ncbi:MAG: Maf family protein [Candidatus Omnitrophica bacterium]|nr:Maf family protein [Candidatus Omnitrophota bacterium]MCM8826750.1 Maf family protein [Candidatus Omnitrophota bacterium]